MFGPPSENNITFYTKTTCIAKPSFYKYFEADFNKQEDKAVIKLQYQGIDLLQRIHELNIVYVYTEMESFWPKKLSHWRNQNLTLQYRVNLTLCKLFPPKFDKSG